MFKPLADFLNTRNRLIAAEKEIARLHECLNLGEARKKLLCKKCLNAVYKHAKES